jgi:hypothetical protein
MNLSTGRQQPQVAKARRGLMKLRIGSQHMIDGKAVVVGNKDDYPQAKTTVRCLHCRGEWATTEEMLAAHPEHRVMEQREESHPWAWFSADPSAPPQKPAKGMSEEQLAQLKAANDAIPPIGLLSDEGF